MCDDLTRPGDERYGALVRTCDDFTSHFLRDHVPLEEVSDSELSKTVLHAFGDGVAVIVVETDYFDLDYRSEFSATHETTFAARNPTTARLHVFTGDAPDQPCGLYNFVKDHTEKYLGYVIIRPQQPGSIGRSMIAPRRPPQEMKPDAELAARVRTAVTEVVTLFGTQLSATAVPFIEQDGSLLRCVHAAAWMCHYTAVLRGVVPRRPTASIQRAEDESYALGRPYPSSGTTDQALSRVLANIDLPAEFVVDDDLVGGREARWYDRKQLWTVSEEDQQTWSVENLTATVCRYLNSGLPTILAQNDDEHAQVVCGYLRADHIAGETDSNPLHSDVVSFVVHDDQSGPYRSLPVADLAAKLNSASPDLTLLIPLPRGLWLDGGRAEQIGAEIFASTVERRHEVLEAWMAEEGLPGEDADQVRSALLRAHDGVCVDLADPHANEVLAVRSYALSGTDFKRGFAEEKADCAEISGLVRLPKYVWVVEILDRDLRAQDGPPAAIGTVVLDGSAIVKRASEWSSVEALLINVPGQIKVTGDDRWRYSTPTPRYSCRWHHDREWLISSEAVRARSKSAMTYS